MEEQKIDGALENLRKGLVRSMQSGEPYVINFENQLSQFDDEYKSSSIFPQEAIFDFENFKNKENYMKILKPEELDNGSFEMHPNFNITLLLKF